MDPNANLKKQEELIELRKGLEAGVLRSEIQRELKELRIALLGWLRGGGFAPQWANRPKASKYYGVNIKAAAKVEIRTNNVPRDVLNFWELTGKEQAQLLDDYSGTGRAEEFCDESMWARYKGHVYCLSEFQRISHHPDSDFSKWEGYEGDSFFSGTVYRFVQNSERVIMGQYFS